MGYSIGIDIGGTKIAAGIVRKSGEILHKKTFQTPQETREKTLMLLKDIVISYTEIAKNEQLDLLGIGIGSAGQVDYETGRILSGTENIQDWNNVPIRDELKKVTTLPIYLDNDANTFAIAEHQLGIGKGEDNIVCLTLGTGIGGGVISGGHVIRGTWGGAAELGHMTVNMNGPTCNCGSKGCIETYASGTGIANRMREKVHDLTDNHLSDYKAHPEKITSKEVFQLAEEGVQPAIDIIDSAMISLGYGIVNLIHIFNPSMIVLGGGLVEGRAWLTTRLKQTIDDIGIRTLVQPTQIELSKLGYDAGLIGAAYQVWLALDDTE